MKVILLFALFGLSFCQEEECKEEVSNPDGGNCPALAVKETSHITPAIAKLACEYYKADRNEENLKAAFEEVGDSLTCAGCKLAQVTSDPLLLCLLTGVGESTGDAGEALRKLLDTMGVAPAAFKVACGVGGKILASDCLKEALEENVVNLIQALKQLYCKSLKSGAADAAANTAELVSLLPCTLNLLQLPTSVELENTHPFIPGDVVVVKRLTKDKRAKDCAYGPEMIVVAVTQTAILMEESPTWIHATRVKLVPRARQREVLTGADSPDLRQDDVAYFTTDFWESLVPPTLDCPDRIPASLADNELYLSP